MLIKDKTAEIKTQWQRADRPARHGTQAGGRTLKGIAISHKENSGPIFRYVYANTQIGGPVAGEEGRDHSAQDAGPSTVRQRLKLILNHAGVKKSDSQISSGIVCSPITTRGGEYQYAADVCPKPDNQASA